MCNDLIKNLVLYKILIIHSIQKFRDLFIKLPISNLIILMYLLLLKLPKSIFRINNLYVYIYYNSSQHSNSYNHINHIKKTHQTTLNDLFDTRHQLPQVFLFSWPRYHLQDTSAAQRTETEFIGRWQ